MKIGILGLAEHKKPDLECDELYALTWDKQNRIRATHLFEPHEDSDFWTAQEIEQIDSLGVPVYTRMGIFKNGEELPDTGIGYFESSVAYMLALAIHKNPEEIHIWGVQMADDTEYFYQRANFEYLVGYARGRGIDVTLHGRTSVCKHCGHFYESQYGLGKRLARAA